ncbi:hypothetical protein F5Y13DRAFT_204154 [Hypoxylon sp. FL1857]|nr:hypothetical protein F5Y13DRAFT_204154 [Hypoxylon sp. FL1857]
MASNQWMHPYESSTSCVRCARASASCIFSPQQRSGRPPLPKPNTRTRPSTAGRTRRNTISYDQIPPSESPLCLGEQLPGPVDLPNGELTSPWCQTISALEHDRVGSLISPSIDQNQLGFGTGSPETFTNLLLEDDGVDLLSGSTTEAQTSTTNNQDQPPDSIETNIQELANLNLRIYRATRAVSSRPATAIAAGSPLHDEMIEATRNLLKIMDRTISHKGYTSAPDQDTSPTDVLSSAQSGNVTPDLSTALMALACHHRLIDMFKKVCNFLQSYLCRLDELSPSPARDCEGGTAQPPEPRFGRFSDTQVMMVLELIIHLLKRLDHGHCHLASAVSSMSLPSSPTPSTLSIGLNNTVTQDGPQARQDKEPQTKQGRLDDILDDIQAGQIGVNTPNFCLRAARSVVERMEQSREKLQMHLKMVENAIWTSSDP